jgi:hypothetical protein
VSSGLHREIVMVNIPVVKGRSCSISHAEKSRVKPGCVGSTRGFNSPSCTYFSINFALASVKPVCNDFVDVPPSSGSPPRLCPCLLAPFLSASRRAISPACSFVCVARFPSLGFCGSSLYWSPHLEPTVSPLAFSVQGKVQILECSY